MYWRLAGSWPFILDEANCAPIAHPITITTEHRCAS